jgi:hypothetical protein
MKAVQEAMDDWGEKYASDNDKDHSTVQGIE